MSRSVRARRGFLKTSPARGARPFGRKVSAASDSAASFAALFARGSDEGLRRLFFVEACLPLVGDEPQRARETRVLEDVAGARRAAIRQEGFSGERLGGKLRGAARPEVRDHVGD